MTSIERWLPVQGFENVYEISNYGRVRSLHHPNTCKDPDGIMIPHNMKGSYSIVLSDRGRKQTEAISHLVLQAFKYPDMPLDMFMYVTHIDGDITNNRIDNLKPDFSIRRLISVNRNKR